MPDPIDKRNADLILKSLKTQGQTIIAQIASGRDTLAASNYGNLDDSNAPLIEDTAWISMSASIDELSTLIANP